MRCCCSVCSRAIERNFSLRFKGNGKKYGHVKQRHREGTPCSNIRHRVGGTKGPTNICLTIKYAKLIYFDPIRHTLNHFKCQTMWQTAARLWFNLIQDLLPPRMNAIIRVHKFCSPFATDLKLLRSLAILSYYPLSSWRIAQSIRYWNCSTIVVAFFFWSLTILHLLKQIWTWTLSGTNLTRTEEW